MVVSVDGLRFVVPVRSLWAGPKPHYVGIRHRGATWLNVINDQVMGIGALVVPGRGAARIRAKHAIACFEDLSGRLRGACWSTGGRTTALARSSAVDLLPVDE